MIKKSILSRLKKDKWSNLKMESNIRANGWVQTDKDLGYKSGLMVLNIKEIGKKIKHSEKENLYMQMEMFTKVSGKTIKPVVLESTSMQSLKLNMKDTGKMI